MMEDEDKYDIPFDYDVFDGPLPKYQGNPFVIINGEKYYLNDLKNTLGNNRSEEEKK